MQGPPIMVDTQGRPNGSAMPQSEHERLKMRWDQTWGPTNRPFRHDKTSVLQLSWAQPHDDLNVGPELSQLGKVFRDVFGYRVRHALLDANKGKAQQQALRELSTFVHEEDEERALLIIYYAGHGHGADVKPGDVRLEGRTKPNAELDGTGIVWSKAEWAIKDTEADILLIFDCCDAGRLGRPVRNRHPKSYFQFLGACSENETTRGPGDSSFTTALIWALKELAREASPFSTAELRAKIMDYSKFPQDQMPILTERRAPYENIMISIKGMTDEASEPAPTTSEREKEMERREHIDLRFHFQDRIDHKHIDHTAEGLKKLLHTRTPQWTRVSFLNKSSLVQRAATKWMEIAREGRRSESGLPPAPAFPDLPQSESPAGATPALPQQPPLQGTSVRLSQAASLVASGGDAASYLSGWTGLEGKSAEEEEEEEESIVFHVRAIVRKLRARLSAMLSRVAKWLMPRSSYERIPDAEI